MNSIENIGNTLRKLREHSGLSANDVSLILKEQYNIDMNHRTLFNYEKGRSSPDVDRFLCLCMIYKCKDILCEFGYTTGNTSTNHITADDAEILDKFHTLPESGKDMIRGALGIEKRPLSKEKIS